ncbi:glycosyltransferase [Fibrobacterota bacterium]
MLKCLHLLNTYLGISETFIWNYLSAHVKFAPLILTGRLANLEKFPLPNGRILSCHPYKSPIKSLLARIRGSYALADYGSCYPDLEKQPVDIIHAHYGYRAIMAGELIKKFKRPFITNFYGFDLSHKGFLSRAASGYESLFKNGDAFFVEGPSMREKLSGLGCPWDKIHIQRIAVNPERYQFTSRSWDGKRPVRFLFIGRLVEKKGLPVALKAFKHIGNNLDWNLTVIGDGPQRGKIESCLRKDRLEDRVDLIGWARPDELPTYYASHDILIQPSQTARDGDSEGGAPTVLLEAQASGMPVLSTLHDDIPNVVKQDKNAFLSEEGDAEGFYTNMVKMIESSGSWAEMGEIGLRNIRENHDVSKQVLELEKKYFSLLS